MYTWRSGSDLVDSCAAQMEVDTSRKKDGIPLFGATGQSIAHVNDRTDEKGKWVLWIIVIWCRE